MLIIGLTGQKRSGKDTAADAVAKWARESKVALHRDSFAAPIRAFFTQHFDMTDSNKEEPIAELDGLTRRQGMVTMGTEWGRDMLHPQIWVWLLFNRLKAAEKNGCKIAVITDVRFEDEAKAIKKVGGHIIQILRASTRDLNPEHRSEQGIPSYLLDHLITNDVEKAVLEKRMQALVSFIYSQEKRK